MIVYYCCTTSNKSRSLSTLSKCKDIKPTSMSLPLYFLWQSRQVALENVPCASISLPSGIPQTVT